MIKMDPDIMPTRITECSNQIVAMEDLQGKMEALVKNLEVEWEGDAQKDFLEKYYSTKPAFGKMIELLGKLHTELETKYTNLTNADH